MPFAQSPVNYAAAYGAELANAYPYLSYYADLWNQGESQLWRRGSGKYVYIPSMTAKGARAVNRDQITGTFNRNVNNDWQMAELDMYREWDTLIDPMDRVETNNVLTIANATRTFNEQQKIPEQDAYASAKLAAAAAGYGGVDTTSLTSANILATWDSYLAYMVNQRVNRDRVRCKMTPNTYALLKEAAGLTRFVETSEGFRGVDRNVARLDGVRISEVPDDMMMDAYDFTEGWVAASGAHQVNLLMYDPMAIAAPIVYETSLISGPTAQSKGKELYYESYYYGLIVLKQRQAGIMVNKGTAPSLASLTVTSVAGSAAGATVITASGANIGMNGTPAAGLLMYITSGNTAAPSVTYGAELPDSVTWSQVSGSPIALASQTAGKYATVALVNAQTGKAVAAGSAVEVVGT